jgi:O-antigen ligase
MDSRKARQILLAVGFLFSALFVYYYSSEGNVRWLLLLMVGGVGAFVLLSKPHVGVLLVLILSFLADSPLVAVFRKVNSQYLTAAVLLVPLGMSIFRDRRIWVLRVPQMKILLAIGSLFLLSTWWSDFKHPVTLIPQLDLTAVWLRLFGIMVVFLVFFLYFINTPRKIEWTAWVLIGLIVVTALSAMLPFLEGEELKRAQASFGIAENSNRLAFMCVFGISLLWCYQSHSQERWRQWMTMPVVFFLTATTLAAGSRSGLLQLLILAVVIIKEQKGSVVRRMQSIVLVGLIIALVLAVVPSAPITRITSYDTEAADKSGGKSLRSRISILHALVEMATSNPILGIGLGNFLWIHKVNYGFEDAPHNSYLWMLTEAGIGVLALYLVLFRITYRSLKQLESTGPPGLRWLVKGLRINLLLFLVFSLFANFWLSIFVYLFVGFAVSMSRTAEYGNPVYAFVPPVIPGVSQWRQLASRSQ